MKTNTKKQIQAGLVDGVLLISCCIAAVITGAAGFNPGMLYRYSVGVISIIELCFFALFFVIESISVFTISDSTWHTVFIAAALVGFHITGVDFTFVIGRYSAATYVKAADALNFLFFELTADSMICFWNYTYNLGLTKKTALSLGFTTALCFAIYILADFKNLGIIAFAIFTVLYSVLMIIIYRRIYAKNEADATFIVTKALLCALVGSALTTNICTVCGYSASGFASFLALPIIMVFLSIYVAFAMRTDRAALKASQYKLQYERVKAQALREQIKPHFVFNTLAAIQSLYRISPDEGDRATNLLSRHLRTNIEAANTDLIPFDKELDNIQVYIDLENMRLSKKIDVIFDVDYTDFEVPILSLQPYIENSIKHSHVNEREGGFIRISSQLSDNKVILEIADNGIGFDTRSIPSTSCGIRNSRERFAMLMGVEPEITSEIGKGTVVKIEINKNDNRVFALQDGAEKTARPKEAKK